MKNVRCYTYNRMGYIKFGKEYTCANKNNLCICYHCVKSNSFEKRVKMRLCMFKFGPHYQIY